MNSLLKKEGMGEQSWERLLDRLKCVTISNTDGWDPTVQTAVVSLKVWKSLPALKALAQGLRVNLVTAETHPPLGHFWGFLFRLGFKATDFPV